MHHSVAIQQHIRLRIFAPILSFIIGFLLIFPTIGKAQIPVEVFVGHEQVQHEFFFFKDLDTNSRVNLFSMARFAVDYREPAFNSSFISSQLTYNFTPNWGLSGGAIYGDGVFAPIVAISYTYFTPKGDFFINLFPTLIIQAQPQVELFGMIGYTPQLTKTLSLFTQVMFGTTFNARFSEHLFSYQQVRLGLGFKDWFQAGIGVDLNFLGNEWLPATNIGVFLRKVL